MLFRIIAPVPSCLHSDGRHLPFLFRKRHIRSSGSPLADLGKRIQGQTLGTYHERPGRRISTHHQGKMVGLRMSSSYHSRSMAGIQSRRIDNQRTSPVALSHCVSRPALPNTSLNPHQALRCADEAVSSEESPLGTEQTTVQDRVLVGLGRRLQSCAAGPVIAFRQPP